MDLEDPTALFKQKFEEKLFEYDKQHQGSHRKPWTQERIAEVIHNLKLARVTMESGERRTSMDYYWMAKYDIMATENEEFLIYKRKTTEDAVIQIVPREDYFGILQAIHKNCGHGGRDKMVNNMKTMYYIPKKAIEIFLSLCPACETKRNIPKKEIDARSIVSHDFNICGHVGLIDFESCSDGDYKWLLSYQDNTTKFLSLRPLKTKSANEVALELMKIFMTFGAPYILQSDNGRELTIKVIEELTAMWPYYKIIYGSPGSPQTHGNVEKSSQDVKSMLQLWMKENNSVNWSVGCFFVQYQNNASFHQIIGRTPYNALFGNDPKARLRDSKIPSVLFDEIESQEQFLRLSETDQQFNEFESNNPHNAPETEECSACRASIPPSTQLYRCVQCVGRVLLCARCLPHAHAHQDHCLMRLPSARVYRILEGVFQKLQLDVNKLLGQEDEVKLGGWDEPQDEPGRSAMKTSSPANQHSLDEPLVDAPQPATYRLHSGPNITQPNSQFDPLHTCIKEEDPLTTEERSETDSLQQNADEALSLPSPKASRAQLKRKTKVTSTKRKRKKSEKPVTSARARKRAAVTRELPIDAPEQSGDASGPSGDTSEHCSNITVEIKHEPLAPDEIDLDEQTFEIYIKQESLENDGDVGSSVVYRRNPGDDT